MSNELSELASVGAWVQAWVERYHVPARTAERLDLCSTEVVTNIMMHGYADRALHQISLRLEWQDEHVALDIQDDGTAFDPRQVDQPQPAASLGEATIGGYGLRLVRQFSDDWRYSRAEGRNHLTLVFRLSRPCRSAAIPQRADI